MPIRRFLDIVFPPKCVFCRRLLQDGEAELCTFCQETAPVFGKAKTSIPCVAGWYAVWYYIDKVKRSIRSFKFYGRRENAAAYAKRMADLLSEDGMPDFDFLTWVPVSRRRILSRGYDQSALLARALAGQLHCACVPVLKKKVHTPPQSGLRGAAFRRGNVIGAYSVSDREFVAGKRILLVDDVVTTGATCSECAKELTFAGADTVICITVAAAPNNKKVCR